MLKEHYNPAPLEIAESFQLGTCIRKESESIADFTVALKKLSIYCNSGVYLKRALRDRFEYGLNHERIQNHLLNTADLTFEHACEMARAMEMAEQYAKEFVVGRVLCTSWKSSSLGRGRVTLVVARRATRRARPGSGVVTVIVSSTSCRDAKCYKCQQRGHIVPACKTTVPYKDKNVN